MSEMDLPPEVAQLMQNGNGQPMPVAPEPTSLEDITLEGLPDATAMTDALGVAVRLNAKKSAAAPDPGQAKDYAQAALYVTQALVALALPESQAPGENPAKKGD